MPRCKASWCSFPTHKTDDKTSSGVWIITRLIQMNANLDEVSIDS